MNTSNHQHLKIKHFRMWGIFLIPQFFMALKILFYRIQSLAARGFDISLPGYISDLPLQLITIFITIYFLFWGRKAANILQYFMNQWQPEYRTDLAAYAIRMLGLIFLLKLIKDVSALFIAILYGFKSDISLFNSIPVPIAVVSIITFSIQILLTWYLLYKGNFLFNIVHRPGIEIKDTCLKAIHCWGLFLLPRFLYSATGFIAFAFYNPSPDAYISQKQKITFLMQHLNYIYVFTITIYLLLFGRQAAILLGFFMNKWQSQHTSETAAFFIRILGMHLLLQQLESIVRLFQNITTRHQWHEFKDAYNLPGILNLTSLPQILTIAAWLAVTWYLLYRGRFLLNFINRPAHNPQYPDL